jgi:hypothetical protein
MARNVDPKKYGNNNPTWGAKPGHLSGLLHQPGGKQGSGVDQALTLSLPELMHQGAGTEHPADHVEWKSKGPSLGKLLGQ